MTGAVSLGSFGDPLTSRWLISLLLASILTLSGTIFAARDISVALTGHVVYLSQHAPERIDSGSDGDPICASGTESADCVVSSRTDSGKIPGVAPEEAPRPVNLAARMTMPVASEPGVRGGDPVPQELLSRPPPVDTGERP